MRFTRFVFALATCAAVSISCALPLAAQTYDARNDFSLAANPNGVWSYGTLGAVTGGLPATVTTAGALTGPVVSVAATVPVTVAGSGTPGLFTLTRSGDTSQKLVVYYTVKGSAKGGFNYAALSGRTRFKPGKNTATVAVDPINQVDALTKTLVKIVLTPAGNFYVGTPDRAKVKIVNLD